MRAKKATVFAPLLFVYGGILHLGSIMRAVEWGHVTVFTVGEIFLTLEFACENLDINNYLRIKTMVVFKNKRGTWTCKIGLVSVSKRKKRGSEQKKKPKLLKQTF